MKASSFPSALAKSLWLWFLLTPFTDANSAPARAATLASFAGPNGANPYGALTHDEAGNLYGTTYGTAFGIFGYGTVFRFTPPTTLTTLATFDNTNGGRPIGGLEIALDDHLYGTTSAGGTSDAGTVFRISTNGLLTTLFSFSGSDGKSPAGRLVLGVDGFLYGTTQLGGSSNVGTVFRISTNGGFSSLASFHDTNGASPYAELVLATDGNFYGTTVNGGTYDLGTVFRITTNGLITSLLSFNGTNGANPYGGLARGPNGVFYGTTAYGGANDSGIIYQISTNGSYSLVHTFSGLLDGANPWASLIPGPDGYFYGTTILGGPPTETGSWGTIFQIATNGQFATLLTFGFDTNGVSPYGSLTELDGKIYGLTFSQGAGLRGTIFQLALAPPQLSISTTPANRAQLSWDTWLGKTYQLQTATNLATPAWSNLNPSITATSNRVIISDPTPIAGTKYYRAGVQLAP